MSRENLNQHLAQFKRENALLRLQVERLLPLKREVAAARALLADVFYFWLSEPNVESGDGEESERG